MIRIKGSGAIYGDVWFDEEPPLNSGVDIVRYCRRHAPIADARCAPFLSIVTDLCVAADAIAGQFGKDCRYKIRRADKGDGLLAEFIMQPKDRLGEFRAFFDAFARQKAHEPCDQQWLRAACEAGQLVLTTVSRQSESLVWHAYVVAGKTVSLHYSCSCFRNRENDYRALVGRANRWLHWQDMLRFKQLGKVRYDWGGLFEDESAPDRAGINEFKRNFGGRNERTYDCEIPVTLKGRIYLPLRDAWRSRLALTAGPHATVPRSPRAT